jgi:hypothetical protein
MVCAAGGEDTYSYLCVIIFDTSNFSGFLALSPGDVAALVFPSALGFFSYPGRARGLSAASPRLLKL